MASKKSSSPSSVRATMAKVYGGGKAPKPRAKKAAAKAAAKPATKTAAKAAPASNRTPGVLPRMGVKAEGRVGTGIRATEWAYKKAQRKANVRKRQAAKKTAASKKGSTSKGVRSSGSMMMNYD